MASPLTVYSDTTDGYISSHNAVYATSRAGSSLASNTTGHIYHGQSWDGDYEYYYCTEGFLAFATDSIPDSATVTSATLSVCGVQYGPTISNTITSYASAYLWGTSVSTADWVPGASLSSTTTVATKSLSAQIPNNTRVEYTSESAFASNVAKSDWTRLIFYTGPHSAGTSTNFDEIVFQSADAAGTTYDPKLVVEYTEGTVSSPITVFGGAEDGVASYTSGSASDVLDVINGTSSYSRSTHGCTLELSDDGDGYAVGRQGFLSFDTSEVPDSATINSVTLSLYSAGSTSGLASEYVRILSYDWGTTVDAADYRSHTQANALTKLAKYYITNVFTWTAQYHTFTNESGMISAINKSGTTYMIWVLDNHVTGTTADFKQIPAYWGSEEGTSNDPKLVITYTAGATTYESSPSSKAVIKKTFTPSAPSSKSIIKKTQTPSAPASKSVIKKTFTPSAVDAKAVVKKIFASTPTAEAVLQKAIEASPISKSVILKPDKEITIDAASLLNLVVTGSPTGKAVVQKTLAYQLDAISTLFKTTADTVDTLSVVKKTIAAQIDNASAIRKIFSTVIDSSTILLKTTDDTLDGKSVLFAEQAETISGKSVVAKSIDKTLDAAARIMFIGIEEIDALAVIQKTISAITTGNAVIQKTIDDSINATSVLFKTTEVAISAHSAIEATLSEQFDGAARICRVGIILWTTPTDTATISASPLLKFTSPISDRNVHFNIQLDTSESFDTVDFRNYVSYSDVANWQYYDGNIWVDFTEAGLPPEYSGNEVSFQVPSPLRNDATWYRRVRGGA